MKIFVNILIGLLITFASCDTPKYLPKPKDVPFFSKGAHIIIKDKHKRKVIEGELIAITDSSLYILSKELYAAKELYSVCDSDIKYCKIEIASTSMLPVEITTWAALLPISTISHGLFAILTMPVNILTSSVVGGSAQSSAYTINYDKRKGNIKLKDFNMYARFPQGLPPGIKLADLETPKRKKVMHYE